MRRVILALVFILVALAPALGEVRVLSSQGGEVRQYLRFFAIVRASGERVVIDGPCMSACTLLLSTVPNNRICVTHRAVLGFHAARAIDKYGRVFAAPEATQVVAETYPPAIRAWIARHGGLTSRLILLRGRELAAIYPRCR
ncbi:MAG TPA: hypothetical protein VEK73_06610 [Xanthobacteraceae bacterium]|nr:hypothetical protein [Xanthobacteraceae bacterium]